MTKRLATLLTLFLLLGACTGNLSSQIEPRPLADLPAWPHGHVAWDADRGRLLYLGKGYTPDDWAPVNLLDLSHPTQPVQVTAEPSGSVVWSPDHRSIAYTATRQHGDRTIETIRAKELAAKNSVDLLPGELAVKSVSTAKKVHGWFQDGELAYEEHRGTGLQQLFLLNTRNGQPFTQEDLLATSFTWNEHGDRVAGQWHGGGPARFWLWDRKDRMFITPKGLPGASQWFEAWSPSGRSALFTAWDQRGWYGQPGARPTLYRIDLETGKITKVADEAGLATTSGDLIAYVKFGERLQLVVERARDGQVLWTDDLGALAQIETKLPWGYQPTIATTFVGYRTADDEWRVSPHVRKESRLLFKGPAATAQWSPFGRYLAVLRRIGEESRLQVFENPLAVGNPVPVEEALRVAHAAALQWRPQVRLLEIIGQQAYEEREAVPPPGSDGRRRGWAFSFKDPVTDEFIIVGTWDGRATGLHGSGTDTSPGFDPNQFRVTGAALVAKAKKAGIRPGTGGIAGFQIGSSSHGPRGFTVSVVGADAGGRGTSIEFDPVTGEEVSG